VNDVDLKKNQLKESPFFSAACQVYFNSNINSIDKDSIQEKSDKLYLLYEDNKRRKEFIKEGELFNKYKHSIIRQSVNNFEKIDIYNEQKRKMNLLVCNQSGLMAKFLANHFQAFSDIDIVIVWYYNISQKGITCIVRSHHDITWLLKQYGGGGLEKAGTFNVKNISSIYQFIDRHNRYFK
jgi:nanoRNase/pAp phosphatase (c-di-AMP/oligoRNAs hydrolase)